MSVAAGMAQYTSADKLKAAAYRARNAGFCRVEAYAPFAVEGLSECTGQGRDWLSLFALLGAVLFGAGSFALQWYGWVWDYPINIGGRPHASWQAFIPPAVEMTLLGAGIGVFLGFLLQSGLPQLHHKAFEVDEFASVDGEGFFLVIESCASHRDQAKVEAFLNETEAVRIWALPT